MKVCSSGTTPDLKQSIISILTYYRLARNGLIFHIANKWLLWINVAAFNVWEFVQSDMICLAVCHGFMFVNGPLISQILFPFLKCKADMKKKLYEKYKF